MGTLPDIQFLRVDSVTILRETRGHPAPSELKHATEHAKHRHSKPQGRGPPLPRQGTREPLWPKASERPEAEQSPSTHLSLHDRPPAPPELRASAGTQCQPSEDVRTRGTQTRHEGGVDGWLTAVCGQATLWTAEGPLTKGH